jgi:hypothetical protein
MEKRESEILSHTYIYPFAALLSLSLSLSDGRESIAGYRAARIADQTLSDPRFSIVPATFPSSHPPRGNAHPLA